MITALRKLYRTWVHAPWLDRGIYAILDFLTKLIALAKCFSFPTNYIRRWKLDMLFGMYEKDTCALFKKILKPGMVVVDIGAHIGYFTRLFSALVGKRGCVYAFEADPTNYALLEQNTRGRGNVCREQLALTDRGGVIDFYHYDDKSGAHSTLPNVPLNFAKKKITVISTTLDSWREQKHIQRVDIIKMDIEGGEVSALRGMTRTLASAKILVTEFAPAWIEAAGSTPLAFLQSIERHGFEISAVTQNGLTRLSPVRNTKFDALLPKPKDGSHASEFFNIWCVKNEKATL